MTGPAGKSIDGQALAAALRSGVYRLIADQDNLNRINVFPVADGDTGTNLSLTAAGSLAVLDTDQPERLDQRIAAFADALLDGSRGNSGAILAQFFQGFSDACADRERLSLAEFARAVSEGDEYARSALSNPREGTILTLISVFAGELRREAEKQADARFADVFTALMPVLDEALARTPEQLDVLGKAGVVDAGARGFVDLVRGMADYLLTGTSAPKPALDDLEDAGELQEIAAGGAEARYRFCTECIVTGGDIDRRKLREALGELGDSLVLAGTRRKAKIHIHVDEPDAVYRAAAEFGEVSAEKADDMHRQQDSRANEGRKFAVITDSAADMADAEIERLDIHVVPMRIQFGNRSYLDKVSLGNEEFFSLLDAEREHPTTSQPAPGDFRRQFQFLASHYPDVISINVTAKVSGTWQAAVTAAERVESSGQVHVVDSRNASLGQGLLVARIAECAAAGLDAEAALIELDSLIPVTRSYALIGDLDAAVKGGRIPGYVRRIAQLLAVTPVIRTAEDGSVGVAGFFVGRRNLLEKFARFVAKRTAPGPVHVAVGHADRPADAARLGALLEHAMQGPARVTTCGIGALFGVHGGAGTLVVATQPRQNTADLAGD